MGETQIRLEKQNVDKPQLDLLKYQKSKISVLKFHTFSTVSSKRNGYPRLISDSTDFFPAQIYNTNYYSSKSFDLQQV